MKEKQIRIIWDCDFFVTFIQKRFPNEQYEDYVREWKSRFMTGNPFVYMDNETLKVYVAVIQNILKNRTK